MSTATKSLSLSDQFKQAIALVDRAQSITVIENKQEYDKCQEDYRSLIQHEKQLDIQYNELQCVIDAKLAQAQKKDLAAKFDAAKKYLKNQPMRKYDDAREAERVAEKRRQAEILRKEQEAETARLLAEQKKIFDANEKERKRLEAIAAKTKDAEARQRALDEAKAAEERAAAARAEAQAVKSDATAAPAPVVVLESTHTAVTRRKVYRWRLTTKDRRQFVKGEITSAVRLGIKDLGPLPPHLYVLSPVLLNEFVDSQGESAAIPGVLEIKADFV